MSRKWRAASVMAASLALAGSALGDHETDRRRPGRGFGRNDSTSTSYTLDPYVGRQAPGRIWGTAAYEVREREIVIPARYETVYDKVWIKPVYQWVTREVWVPARRRHRHLDLNVGKFSLHLNLGKGRKRHRRGHYETVRERVLVHAGHYETVAREVLVERVRVEVVREQIRVRNGFWKNVHRHADTGRHDVHRFGPRVGLRDHHGGRAFKGKNRRTRLHRSSRR